MSSTKGLLRNLRVSTKVVVSGLAITTLFIMTIYLWILPAAEERLLARKREKIKEATETAWSVMAHFDEQVAQQKLSIEDAKTRAVRIIKGMRYGPEMKDYFWINDMHPMMIMHPYRADLDGTDLTEFKDPKGVALFVEFTKVCHQDGAGFVGYDWQWKDDAKRIVPKISYVRLYRPWGWIVGTGMYIEDVHEEIRDWRREMTLASFGVALIGVLLSWLIGQEVGKRIRFLSSHEAGEVVPHEGMSIRLQSFVLFAVVPALLVVTLFWSVRFYRELHGIIIEGFDRKLFAISSTTGCFIKGEDHARILKERDPEAPLVRQYTEPMGRIVKATGLTYLYTQVLGAEKPACTYVLDATGESAIGDEDELAIEDYEGGEKVALYGVVHVGEVRPTGKWGLLKVSYAPIYNADDTISSMAGADVNISVIDAQTRTALFGIGLLAVGAVLGAVFISFLFSRRLIRPVTALRDGALMIAAGSHDHRIEVHDPDEFTRVTAAFNGIGDQLKATVHDVHEANQVVASRKLRRDLVTALDRPWADVACECGKVWAVTWFGDEATERRVASGWAHTADAFMAWLAPGGEPLVALPKRNELAAVARGVLAQETRDAAGRVETADVFGDAVTTCLIRTRSGVAWVGDRATDVLWLTEDGQMHRGGVAAAPTSGAWWIVTDAVDRVFEMASRADLAACRDAGAVVEALRGDPAAGEGSQIMVAVLAVGGET